MPNVVAMTACRDSRSGILGSHLGADARHTGAGLNNDFLINSGSEEAKIYHDRSVNENMHLRYTFKLLEREENNFVCNLSRQVGICRCGCSPPCFLAGPALLSRLFCLPFNPRSRYCDDGNCIPLTNNLLANATGLVVPSPHPHQSNPQHRHGSAHKSALRV